MKAKWKSFLSFLNRHYFLIFAILGLLLPDLQLRYLVWPKVYGMFYATWVPLAFNLCWIFLFLYGSLVLLPKRWGRILYLSLGGVFVIFSFAQYIYFQIFEQFFRLSGIGLAGEGSDYFSYALSYMDKRLITFTVLSILCLVITGIRWERPVHRGKIAKAMSLVPVLLLVSLHIFMQPDLFGESDQDWNSWSQPRVVYEQFNDANKSLDVAGIYHFAARDFYKTWIVSNSLSAEERSKISQFVEKKSAQHSPNEYTGLLKGKNVIAVMLEGIDDWMITEKYTPTMKYMMENGINFKNHYAPTFGTGYTLGSEFCFNTGFYTPISGVSAVNYASNKYPYALPQLFKNQGYSANSFHYNHSEFYNRGIMHKSQGFEKYHSFQDYGIPDYVAQSDSKILSVEGVYEDIVKDEPFFSFVITYSGHVPYTYDDAKLAVVKENHPNLVDNSMDFEENSCHLLARDTDDFFRQLLERLNADNILDDTVIVVFTDHYAYGYSDQNKLLELNKAVGDDIMYRVPAFIYTPGLEPLEITKPTHTADLFPTMINLFDLENSYCYIGSDALSPESSGFVYFGNASWIDDTIYYVPSDKEVPADISERVNAGNQKLREAFDINDAVIIGNYFAR
ncbi:MAG: sulfatase-like hydrolase/transferase [Clostridia bacterium]|nr:sulfatase-like hydrolase/transferase [Clostridia bacterium]